MGPSQNFFIRIYTRRKCVIWDGTITRAVWIGIPSVLGVFEYIQCLFWRGVADDAIPPSRAGDFSGLPLVNRRRRAHY